MISNINLDDLKIRPKEKLPPGYRNEWNTWKTLDRLIGQLLEQVKICMHGIQCRQRRPRLRKRTNGTIH